MPPALAGALLAALRSKGVTADEVRGFARAMRALARQPAIPPGSRAIDIVGTGGDSSGSFNLSTGAALLTAACGVDVVKHGNRSVSSKSGSADVLEQLGLKLPLDESAAGACLAATRFTFLFAPHYHPAMKAVAPIRQAMGVRTVFNILGPLTNPAAPLFQLTGAFNLPTAQLMAETLSGLPIERAFVVHGAEGWDEPTPLGPFTVLDVRPGAGERRKSAARRTTDSTCAARAISPAAMPRPTRARCAPCSTGERHGPHRDALLLGTALALEIVGRVDQPARWRAPWRSRPSTAAPRAARWTRSPPSARVPACERRFPRSAWRRRAARASAAAQAQLSERELRARIADLPARAGAQARRFRPHRRSKTAVTGRGSAQAGKAKRMSARASARMRMPAPPPCPILTEPSRFDGSLEDLAAGARALAPLRRAGHAQGFPGRRIPGARRPRCRGGRRARHHPHAAAGRISSDSSTPRSNCNMFVLLEAFDAPDIELAHAARGLRAATISALLLVGVNSRDLATLKVVPGRLDALASSAARPT